MLTFSDEQKLKFASIMFQQNVNPYNINELTEEQRKKLQAIYAQKIAFQTVNQPQLPPKPQQAIDLSAESSYGGVLETICCCFYPQSQRSNFDLTTPVFLKRSFGTLLFWKSDWLQIGDKLQLYGFLWFITTYILTITMVSNLSNYFGKKDQKETFQIDIDSLLRAFGVVMLFGLACPFIYKGGVGCLGGSITALQTLSLYGYSLILVIIPTIACIVASSFWQFGMIILGFSLQSIFLYRNYSSKLDAKGTILLVAILALSALQFLITFRVFFSATPSQSLDEAFKHLYHIHLRHMEY